MHKNIKLLAWINFFTDLRLYGPIAILYFSGVTGSFALGMSIFSVTQIASAVFEVPTGIFSDKIGRRNTLLFGAVASVISVSLYAVGGSYWMLFAGAVIEGLARSFFSGNNDALLHDSLKENNLHGDYHTYLGKTSSLFGVASAVSSLLGGIIAFYSFSLVMWLSVIPQLCLLFTALFVVEPKIQKGESGNIYAHLREAVTLFLKNRHLRNFSIANFFSYGLGEAGYQFQAAFYSLVWPVWAIGIAKMLSSIFGGVSYYFSGKLIDRFTTFRLIVGGTVYARFVTSLALLFPTLASPLIMSTTSLFHGVLEVGKNSLVQKEFTDQQRATMGSLISLGSSLMFAVIAFLLGFFADRIGPSYGLFLIQVLQVPVLFMYIMVFRHKKLQGAAS